MSNLRPAALRRLYGPVLASVVRRLGTQHLAVAEDAVQDAWVAALERWPGEGPPEHPSAWLATVAWRKALDRLRTAHRRDALLRAHAPTPDQPVGVSPSPGHFAAEIPEALLRLCFACCDPALAQRTQLALALKTLMGLGVPEIACLLFMGEAAVYKRLARARVRLREAPPRLDTLTGPALSDRLPTVLRLVYLLFTEGHLSAAPQHALRHDLMRQAIDLGAQLAQHPAGQTPETFALLALMHLHRARVDSRTDDGGALLLLAEQDRTRWDQAEIATGLTWLARAAQGPRYSRYHAEAGIAAAHCLAPDLQRTRWDHIARGYAQLERLAPSALHRLNRALAVAEAEGPAAGLALLEGVIPPGWLAGSYQWSAALADLHGRCGHAARAARHRARALEDAPTAAIRAALARRLGAWGSA